MKFLCLLLGNNSKKKAKNSFSTKKQDDNKRKAYTILEKEYYLKSPILKTKKRLTIYTIVSLLKPIS